MKPSKYLLLLCFVLGLAYAAVPTGNSLTYGLVGNALYSWEKSGFLLNECPVYLPTTERLAENPQVLDVDQDGSLELLVRTVDQANRQRIYQELFAQGNFSLSTVTYNSLTPITLKGFYQTKYPSSNVAEAQLKSDSILGRVPVFQCSPTLLKKYGELYHFSEDVVSPTIALDEYTTVFSPNGDGFKDETNCIYSFSDDHSAFAIDVFIEVIAQDSGLPVYTEIVRPYTMLDVTLNYYWSGRTNAGTTANEGWYYLKLSGTDEAGNPVSDRTEAFYLKLTPAQIEHLNYTIVNTDYPQVVMQKSPKMSFNLTTQEAAVSTDRLNYQLRLSKQEDATFTQSLYGSVSGSVTNIDWYLTDSYERPLSDGFYTAECELIDDVGLISKRVSVSFEINREPIRIAIAKDNNVFTPHNTTDTYPDVAEFTITLTDRGLTVNEPYSYQILSPQNAVLVQRTNYRGDKIVWDGQDLSGKFVADGLYTLKVITVDNIGNTCEASERIIKTKIPVDISAPNLEAVGNNMLPIVGTVIDPGGSTFMDFEKFEIFVRSGAHTDFTLTENNVAALDPGLWQTLTPLPYYMSATAENFPQASFGVNPGYKAKLAFWQPTQNGRYTLLLRVQDKEQYVAFEAKVLTVNLTQVPPLVLKLAPAENTTFNINTESFAVATHWDTQAFNNLFSYEVNIYAVSGDKKTKLVRNYSKAGNVPGNMTQILWDGKDQWRKYVASGAYILEVYFYDLNENSLARQELKVFVNNYYADPLLIKRYEIVKNEVLFVSLSEPASCNVAIYSGLNKVYSQDFVYTGAELAITLPELAPGFYRVNLTAASLGSSTDIQAASLTVILNQELARDGAELELPTGNIEPQHYFAFTAERTGEFYPEVTGSVTVKLTGVREKYPYDPYTLAVVFSSAESFFTYSDDVAGDGFSIGDDEGDSCTVRFTTNLAQDMLVNTDSDYEGSRPSRWWRIRDGVYRIEGQSYSYSFGGSTADSWENKNELSMGMDIYYKWRNINYDQKTIYWKNINNYSWQYSTPPAYTTLQAQLPPMLDKFYMQRGTKKNLLLNLRSPRPEYEKDMVKTYHHWRCGSVLWHYGETPKFHHEWNIWQQIEYDEEEFVKTSVVDILKGFDDGVLPGDTAHGTNYITVNIEVDNFAEPQREPFEFTVTIPFKALYQGHDFYSGNLAVYANALLGGETQFLQIPYRVTDNLKYFPVEMPISTNTLIYSAQIVSTLDSRVSAQITYSAGYPQLLAQTKYTLPWNSSLDSNLQQGQLRGVVAYDPLNNEQIKLADYYPPGAITRETSMFIVDQGLLRPNPQVNLTGSWNIVLKEVRDPSLVHKALSLGQTYYLNGNAAGDYFTVKLAPQVGIEAYLPVQGWIADGYRENGYTLFIRESTTSNWQEDSTYLDYFPAGYRLKGNATGYLLGFVQVSNYNAENVLRLVASGTKGNTETLANLTLGKKVVKGLQTRVYAYDYLSWLDIYPGSLVSANTYYITLSPQCYDPTKMNLPADMASPWGPIYSMRPHGLRFATENRPLLTSVLSNTSTENIDLSRLVVYHLSSDAQLSLAQIYALQDSNADGFLAPQELGSMSSFVEGFSQQFYVPALRKLIFDKYKVYSSTENVLLKAQGSPTGNLEGFLNGRHSLPADIDQPPQTPSGDYLLELNLPEGRHTFEAREYQLVNSYKSVGPFSAPVEILVDLADPVLSINSLTNTLNGLSLEVIASERATLNIVLSSNIWTAAMTKGTNQLSIALQTAAEGVQQADLSLLDLSGRTSKVVTIAILCDNTPPTGGRLLAPTTGQNLPSAVKLIYIAPSDASSGLADLQLQYASAGAWKTLAGLDPQETSRNIYILGEDGPRALRLLAKDKAGQSWSSAVTTINIENNYIYKLDETKLLPLISANIHQVVGYTTTVGFCESGTELMLLKDPAERTVTTDISSQNAWVYLVGKKFGQYTNIIPLPIHLPCFTQDLYAGEDFTPAWSGTGTITYAITENKVTMYYQPVGSTLVYLADTATLNQLPQVQLNKVLSTQVRLAAESPTHYRYKPVSGNVVSINYVVNTALSRALTIYPYQDLPTRTIQVQGGYELGTALLAEQVTISVELAKANSLNIIFTKDTVCYPPEELSQSYSNSVNLVSWHELQTDIAGYAARVYLLSKNGTESLVQTFFTTNNYWPAASLTSNVFYRFELNSRDDLGNIAATRAITFYSGNGQVFSVKPLHFTQFVDKAVGLSFAIGTFEQEVLYAYQPYPAQVITGNIYLYQAYELLTDITITPNQPITRYFDVLQLDQQLGGELALAGLYYFKNGLWQVVPSNNYTYDPGLKRYYYLGSALYPLAIGAKRFTKWCLDGVSANYVGLENELELNLFAQNVSADIVTRSTRLSVVSTNLQVLANTFFTNAAGYGVLPIKLGLGREVTYSLHVVDGTGVTGSIVFYAAKLPVSFNGVVLDGWQRVTSAVTLREGLQYLLELDVQAYAGAQVTYELSDYIKMDLGQKTQFTFRPDYRDAGVHRLNIHVKNGEFSIQTYTLTVNVLNTNRKPFIENEQVLTVVEQQEPPKKGMLNILDQDEDDTIQDIQFLNVPANFKLQRVPGKPIITYELKPAFDQQGTHNIAVRIYDGQDWTTENILVFVQNVNQLGAVVNRQRVNVLENQLVTYAIDVYEPDNDPVQLDFAKFPCAAGVISSANLGNNVTRFQVWTRPGFVSTNYLSYDLGLFDGYDLKLDTQQFNIGKDLVAPVAVFAKTPESATYALNYRYCFAVSDNVWTTFNIKVYRGTELIFDSTQGTNNIWVAPPLVVSQNVLRFVFTDGAGNQQELTHTIKLENIVRFDPATGIYVELPVGAYDLDLPVRLVSQDPAALINSDWQAGHLPYTIAKFTEKCYLATFDSSKVLTPLDALTTLNVPAKFVVKMPKPVNSDQKLNPVVWDNAQKRWLAHTAKRLSAAEFGPLSVPTAIFGLGPNEELVYFESPVLGLISLMAFETQERPQIRLANPEDYYDVGQNKILFMVRGNYLRLENTKMWLNGVTLNPRLAMDKYMDNFKVQSLDVVQSTGNALIAYDPSQELFMLTVDGFVQGENTFRVAAENLVHQTSSYFSLAVNTAELDAKEIYAYPNPARETGEQMVRFSCILSKPAEIKIRIYTAQGHLLKELAQAGVVGFNAVPWDGKDNYNNQVANGMYLYVITIDDGDKKITRKKKVGILL